MASSILNSILSLKDNDRNRLASARNREDITRFAPKLSDFGRI